MDITDKVISAFLYLMLLSVIGSSVADVLGTSFGVTGQGKRVLSTIFCFVIILGWKIGLFSILFGDPKVVPHLVGSLDIKTGFFRLVDIFGTSLVVGAGSGAVADMFKMLISKVKEWEEISTTNKKVLRGDKDAASRLAKTTRQPNVNKG